MQYLLSLARLPYVVPSLFLAATLVGAAFALNAHRPFSRSGKLSISVFFAGWLTTELPIHHFAWQLLATGVFIWLGALSAWPGWLGLGMAVASWAGLLTMFLQAGGAAGVVEKALSAALGDAYGAVIDPVLLARAEAPMPLSQLLLPFAIRHPEVERIKDLPYGPSGHRNRLDIYKPRGASRGCPVLLQVHGGAWVLGDKAQQGVPLMTHMASLGWVCVAINYRLSPRATFPDHIVDVKKAIAWVKEHIAGYGGDPGFIAITGGSAGGHLTALAALTPNDPEYQPGFESADTTVQAAVPFYGVYDFTNRKGIGRGDMLPFLARHVLKKRFDADRPAFDRASPMSRVNAGAPPFLIIHGTHDTLVPVEEGRLFAEMLREVSRAAVAYAEIPGAQHAFEVFASARTAHVVRGVARFLAHVHAAHLAAQAPAAPALDAEPAVSPPAA